MQAVVNKKLERQKLLERQIQRLERRLERLTERYRRIWLQQFMVFGGSIFVSSIAFGISVLLGLACFLAGVGLFIYGWRTAGALRKSGEQHEGMLRVKKTHIARMNLDWENIPPVEDTREKDHPFENDLQISGPGSLYQLISTCYSDEGRARLRQWLLNRVPDLEAIRTRQGIVRDLIGLVSFRDKLQLHSRRVILDINQQADAETLLLWLDLPVANRPPLPLLVISYLLSAVLIGLFILLLYGQVSLIYVLGALGVSFLWSIPMTRYSNRLFTDVSVMHEIFKQLHAVFAFLETYPYGNHTQLKKLCEPFFTASVGPSLLMRRLRRISRGAMLTQNQLTRQSSPTGLSQGLPYIFNVIMPWDLTLSYLLSRCKAQAKEHLPRWIDAWYELEALCSLANFAYLNPDFAMPEIADRAGSPAFSARQLGHPLIPDEERIVNDVTIERVGDIMLITGSNMAGKSTFLRTLGINLCLAYAGSVVSAAVLTTGLYELNCCISVSDSLADGYSYFYAEVRRLRLILDRLREKSQYPIFVLIDEIFKGTNNRERSIGSHAYIYALAEATCIGAISTHDLELVKLADELSQVKNYHFREEVVNDEMLFDYRLYTGPCPTTNALKIMQKEGLPITWAGASASA